MAAPITPAAGFATQQAYPRYLHTSVAYATDRAYGKLVPWAGFAVPYPKTKRFSG